MQEVEEGQEVVAGAGGGGGQEEMLRRPGCCCCWGCFWDGAEQEGTGCGKGGDRVGLGQSG